MIAGASSSDSRPKTISAIAIVSTAFGLPCLQVEFRRRLRNLFEDPVRVEPHDLPVDLLSRAGERGERLVVQEVDPELAHDATPAALELLHRCLVEDLVTRQLVDQH